MSITSKQLLQILPNAGKNAGVFAPALNAAMDRYQIVGAKRVAAFIAQIGHESGQLSRLVENLNYSQAALLSSFSRSRISEKDALVVGRSAEWLANQEAIANFIYGGDWGLKSLGNTQAGDGWKYRGRGLIQITGRANYAACGEALGVDLLDHPYLLEQPQYAALSAAWFWATQSLNTLADLGDIQNIGSLINTGRRGRVPKGASERLAFYQVALKALA